MESEDEVEEASASSSCCVAIVTPNVESTVPSEDGLARDVRWLMDTGSSMDVISSDAMNSLHVGELEPAKRLEITAQLPFNFVLVLSGNF